MNNQSVCIGGDGGPLVVLQTSAISRWQGATDFENSILGGGDVETDYDVICERVGSEDFTVIPRHGREMLVLWDSEFGASVLPPHMLSRKDDVLVLTMCYATDDLPDILPHIRKAVAEGKPEQSCLFQIQDTSLRLQVGADGGSAYAYNYEYLDIPVSPGVKQCNVYLIEHDSLKDTVVVIDNHQQSPA